MNLFQDLKERKVLDKDGKVDALGPYGRSKLTGQEVAQYFKKNKLSKVHDRLKKAIEVALDLGGADTIARKEIKKFYGSNILKNKEVQKALKYANESFEMNQLVGMLHEEINNLTEKSLIPDLQKIVDTKGAAKVGGVMVDMFTASMITQIYDKVNDQNKKKMDKSKIAVLVDLAHRMMRKSENDPTIEEGRALKPKQIAKKYKREIEQLAKRGQSPEYGKHKVYQALYNLAWENGDIGSDDPDDINDVIDDYMDDIMGEFFAHIKEGFASDAQRRAAFASGYKAKGKKGKKDKKEEVDLEENEKGLKNKAEKSGMPLGILKQVYNRGLAAYKTGHRPGATAPQWAMARVNSFVTKSKGTWGGADKDLAAKVQGKKEEVDTLRNTIDEWIAADGTRRRVHEKDKRKQKGKTPMESYREMWEDSLLEKKELDPRAIAKIAKMTDSNNHNAAVITLSKHMKEKKVENMMNLLTKMHKEMGHMTSDMIAMRRDLMKQLLDKAKKNYSNFDDINKSF
tara:strand:+ start:99 stop:1637 length:1539 start_codon:yes stop_codon:yes gene_type:complete